MIGSQTSEHLQEEDVLVPGETVPENDDPNAEGTIPIRFLSDFSVFDTRTRVLQHLDTLLDLEDEDSSTISALGLVSAGPAACDSDDSDTYSLEDDTEPVGPVLLLKVLELSVHSVSEDASDKMLDR